MVDSQTRALLLSEKLGAAILRCFRHSSCSVVRMLGPYVTPSKALEFLISLVNAVRL